MAGQSTQITGVVSAISKKGSVKLNQYGKWAKVVETNSDDATRDGWERDSEKKLRSRTESSSKESQRTLPLNVSAEQKSKENLVKVGDKVEIKTGRSKRKIGIVSAVSKKGKVKLDDYRRFAAVVRIIKCNDSIGNFGERDSIKKPRSRTESSVKRYHSSLSTNNNSTSSRWERLRERINTPSKKPHSKHLKFDKDVGTIRQGYLSDNAVKCSLKKKEKVYIMDSVEAKYFHREGFLTAKIAVLRNQANIEDIFVILHFDGPPAHFACLHVKKSSLVYYDSLPNNNNRPRPFNEYPELQELGDVEFHVPTEYQVEEECGCMVVLRYWQLFYNEQHTHLRGKEARDQVLKYYNRDNSKEANGTDNCDEEQIQQTRSRTALTHKGPSSRLFRRCLRKRLQ